MENYCQQIINCIKTQFAVKPNPKRIKFLIIQIRSEISLVQTTSIHLYLVVGNLPEALREFESRITDKFILKVQADMNLRTIVNFTAADLGEAKGAALVQQVENKLFIVKKGDEKAKD